MKKLKKLMENPILQAKAAELKEDTLEKVNEHVERFVKKHPHFIDHAETVADSILDYLHEHDA